MEKDSILIVTLANNNMKLDELIQLDRTNGSGNQEELRLKKEVSAEVTGLNVPYLTINGYSVTNFLTKFNMDLSGFLPVIRFSFIAGKNVFISANYPKDGDLVSLYMRSPGDIYKPIRMDFNILTVHGDVTSKYAESGSDPEGRGVNLRFSIVAECRIPGLYTNRIKSFPASSSFDTLLEACQEINLGFASNEKSLSDNMTWLCPNYSYFDFFQEVTMRAFKDDVTSFFDCWIDPYYNLNFINLGNQFAFETDPQQKVMILPGYTNQGVKIDAAIPGASAPEPQETTLVLSNFIGYGQVPFFINGFTLTSRAGSHTNEMGYINEISFYDENLSKEDPAQKYIKYDIESFTTDNVGTGAVLQKGRARDEEYKEEKRREWLGILNSQVSPNDGVHNNFLHAKAQNLLNINDSTKLTLEVELDGFFPGIIKGMVIPVILFVFDSGMRKDNTGNLPNTESPNSSQPQKDVFLSGNYVVMGIRIEWSPYSPGMKQYLSLAKRTWYLNTSGTVPKAYPISVKNRKIA
jgi:hypothetical protein